MIIEDEVLIGGNTGLYEGAVVKRRAVLVAIGIGSDGRMHILGVEVANREAGTLAYGQQRRLEIARCMMTRPSILMLDEPAVGLNPRETEDLKELIGMLRDEHNVTVLLIEHDMKLVMSISDHIYVINQGTPLADGTPEQIRNNPDVIKAYLGEA